MAIKIREAEEKDAEGMWELIHELAIFERSEQEHIVSPGQLRQDLAENRFKAFVAETEEGSLSGMALLYPVYSTWKGASWYLEDLIVAENTRRSGIGSLLFEKAMAFASEENAGRLSWQVLDWNEPAINFYKKYKAEMDPEWITCRIRQESLKKWHRPKEAESK
jgi:GNAT superfamily N-acetyltransferase